MEQAASLLGRGTSDTTHAEQAGSLLHGVREPFSGRWTSSIVRPLLFGGLRSVNSFGERSKVFADRQLGECLFVERLLVRRVG